MMIIFGGGKVGSTISSREKTAEYPLDRNACRKLGQSRGFQRVRGIIFLALFGLAGSPVQAEILTIGGTGSALGTMRALAQVFEKGPPSVEVVVLPSLGTGGGIKALAAGKIDLAVAARPLKKKEQTMLPGARSVLYGVTPLGLVTPRDVSVDFTAEQLAKVLDGTVADWPDGGPIRFILRPKRETDFQLLGAYSPLLDKALAEAREKPDLLMAFTDQQNLDLAEKVVGSIAITTMSTVISEGRALNTISLDGIAPTVENLANGSYRLSRNGYFIVRSDAGPTVQRFIDFSMSDRGTSILRTNGYLPAR